MKQLHFQPIQGKGIEIIQTITQIEEVVSLDQDMWRIICVVVEELVLNIVSYSGSDYIDVEIQYEKDCFTMRFRDGGAPFNPLKSEQPDVTLPIEQRQVGGLGIFMVIYMMDTVEYEYVNGENVLTTTLHHKK